MRIRKRQWPPHLARRLARCPAQRAPPPSAAATAPLLAPLMTDAMAGAITACIAPSAAAIVACSLSVALKPFPLARLAITFFAPVSDRGQPGVDELENQTVKLLSLQPMPQAVFDTQIAFTLLDRWGSGSAVSLSTIRATIASEVREYLAGRLSSPAINLVHAPVFFGCAFSAYAEFAAPARAATAGAPAAGAPTFDITAEVSAQQLAARLSAAGFTARRRRRPAALQRQRCRRITTLRHSPRTRPQRRERLLAVGRSR